MPKKAVYDDEKVPLKALIAGTPITLAKVKTVDFIITTIKDGNESDEAPVAAPVTIALQSSATLEYAPKAVADDADFYDFKYKVEVKHPTMAKKTVDGTDDVRVWPRKVELTFTSDDNKAHKQAKFRIESGGKLSAVHKTGDDGKWSETVGKNTFKVKAEPPWELVAPVTHKGRKRSYKVKKNAYKVEFVKPKQQAPNTPVANAPAAIKQYVNLDEDVGGWADDKPFGRVLNFTVGAEGDLDRSDTEKWGKQDDVVYVEVNFTPKTKRNDPKPKLLDDGLDGSAVESNSGKTFKGKLKLDAKGQGTFKVDLGFAGGDICEVRVGTDNTCADCGFRFETWRRLFYELMYFDGMAPDLKDEGGGKHDFPATLKSTADTRLAAAFIEYVRKDSLKYTKVQAAAGTVVAGDFVDQAGRDRVVLGGALSAADPVAFGLAEPRVIHVKLADLTYSTSAADSPENPKLDKNDFEFTKPNKAFVPFGVDVAACEWKAEIADASVYHKHPTIAFSTADTVDAVNKPYVVSIEETTQKKTLDLEFARDNKGDAATTLAGTETAKIDPFILSLIGAGDLRKQGNKVELKVSRPNATAADGNRYTLVKNALEQSFNTQKQKVYIHPGLNEDGTVRTGAVDAAWFSALKLSKIKISLPTSQGGAQALPGDLVDAAESDTKCPISLTFTAKNVTYAINGNSGAGRQLFQIRPPPRTPGAMASTLCHELGHSMGMTIMAGRSKIPPGTDPAKHVDNGGVYYVNGNAPYNNGKRNLGVGAHCATGVANKAPSNFAGGTGTCVMFHAGGDADTRPSYCAECAGYLQARRLTDIRSAWNARNNDEY